MNDATISRSETERLDWAYLGYLMQNIENNTVLADVFTGVSGRTLQYQTKNRRRRVRQCFTVTLTETAMDGEEGLGDV